MEARLNKYLHRLCASAERRGKHFPPEPPSDLKYAAWPTPEQYTTFPEGYKADNWGIDFIYADKGSEQRNDLELLVEWKPNPVTKQRFKPSWIPKDDLLHDTYQEWLEELQAIDAESKLQRASRTKRSATYRIIDDTSSEVEETSIDNSIDYKIRTVQSTGADSSHSSQPEIGDSQGVLNTHPITVVIPDRRLDEAEYLPQALPASSYSPPASINDLQSPLVVSTSLEALRGSYPTPSTEPEDNPQDPTDSLSSQHLFYPESVLLSSPETEQGLLLDSNSKPELAHQIVTTASHPIRVAPGPRSDSQNSTQSQVSASVASQTADQSHFHSAQVVPTIPTSPVTDSQLSLGQSLFDLEGEVQKSATTQPKRKLFVPFRQGPEVSVEAEPFLSKLLGSIAEMSTPSQRSGAIVPHPSTPLRNSRAPILSLQEQLSQSRASRRNNGISSSPKDTAAPILAPVREPASVVLGRTMSSNLRKSPKPETINETPQEGNNVDPSSAMQVDDSELSVPSSAATTSARFDQPGAPISLQIHQSIENGDMEQGTQSSGHSGSSQFFGDGQAAIAALVPNYPILGPVEYVIPLHAEGKTQGAYSDAIRVKTQNGAIKRFLRKRRSSSSTPASDTPKSSDANEMSDLVERLDATTTLLDLGYDGQLTQTSYSSDELAKWAVQASSKFAFLELLVQELQDKDCAIAIYAKAGHTQKVLENFFSVKRVNCQTSGAPSAQSSFAPPRGLLTVYLIASGQALKFMQPLNHLSLIIALDTSFNAQDQVVEKLRQRPDIGLVPVIHLLVAHSSEHIERCLPKNMPSPQRNRLLIRCILESQHHMGHIQATLPRDVLRAYYYEISTGLGHNDEYGDLQHNMQTQGNVLQKIPGRHLKFIARQVAQAVLNGIADAWLMVTPMPILEFDSIITEPISSVQVHSPTPVSPIGTPATRKRLLDGDSSDPATNSKRQRLTPLPSPAQVSDSALQILNLNRALKIAQDELGAEKEARSSAEKAREHALGQLNEWKQDVSKIQRRVERYTKDSHENRSKVKQLEVEAERRNEQQERTQAEKDALKTQLIQLREELAVARADLKAAGGDVAALEAAREEGRLTAAKLAASERSLANFRRDFDFMRSQYQEASAKAVENAQQVDALETQAVELRKMASDERRRLKEVNYRESIKAHLARIEKLEFEKRNLELLSRKMDEELKMLRKNRGVTTRASSVQPQPPGSPRTKSRGGSPVPGLLAAVAAAHAGSRASALRHER